jgi:osmotically-inducible protein OsmY
MNPMSKWTAFMMACFLSGSVAFAAEIPTDDPTPRERVEENMTKLEKNPALRGRSNPKERQPASAESQPSDVSTEKILQILQNDEKLKDSAFKIKVTAKNGVVKLEGVVNNEEEKALIGEKAMIEGVKSVENGLTIKTDDKSLLE